MGNLKRDVLINVLGAILSAPLLLGLTWTVNRLSADPGIYLTVAQSIKTYGVLSVLTIEAENTSRVGFAPLEAEFPTDGRLVAAGARSVLDASEPVTTDNSVKWSGKLPARSSVAFVLVFKGVAPTINLQTAFVAQYSSTDASGFGVTTRAHIRTDSEATAARLLLVAKWLGGVAALFIVIAFGRYASGRFGRTGSK